MKIKQMVFVAIFIWPIFIHCQKNIPLIISNGDVFFEAIAIADSLTADEIHNRTLNWLGSKFKNARYVIASDTPEKIVRQITIPSPYNFSYRIYDHEITFEIKEGRVKFRAFILGSGFLVNNLYEWRPSSMEQRQIFEKTLNELYQSYLLELQTNESDW